MSGCAPVVFDYCIWESKFPDIACSVPESVAETYFGFAELYVDNSPTSPVPLTTPSGVTVRAAILGMTVAHIATLLASINGNAPNPLVGRISNASEGSVSVAVDLPITAPDAAWWTQTKFGLMAWQALAPFRTALYIQSPRAAFGGYGGYLGRGGSSWPR